VNNPNSNFNKIGAKLMSCIVGDGKSKRGIVLNAFDYFYHSIIGSLPYRDNIGDFLCPKPDGRRNSDYQPAFSYDGKKAEKNKDTFMLGMTVASCLFMPYLAPVFGLWCVLAQHFSPKYEKHNPIQQAQPSAIQQRGNLASNPSHQRNDLENIAIGAGGVLSKAGAKIKDYSIKAGKEIKRYSSIIGNHAWKYGCIAAKNMAEYSTKAGSAIRDCSVIFRRKAMDIYSAASRKANEIAPIAKERIIKAGKTAMHYSAMYGRKAADLAAKCWEYLRNSESKLYNKISACSKSRNTMNPLHPAQDTHLYNHSI